MKIILIIFRYILSLRYKINIKGVKLLKEHNGPTLILPNHVALVDPLILVSNFYKYKNISAVASEKYYNKPGIHQIMSMFGTIPIGDFENGGNKDNIKDSLISIKKGLYNGKNILIYPSGQIYRQGFESIIGKQTIYNIIQDMPSNTKVLGVKTKGLWGSMYSTAWDNGNSGLGKIGIESLFIFILNLIFFIPKRIVNIEIIDITENINIYKNMSQLELNKFLENFYNKEGEEKITYIKHYFYFNDVKNKKAPDVIIGSLQDLKNIKNKNIKSIPNSIKESIKNKIIEIKDGNKNLKLNENTNLILELYFDSLDISELKNFIQSKYEKASNPPTIELKTIADLYLMAIGNSSNEEKLKECKWKEINNYNLLINKLND